MSTYKLKPFSLVDSTYRIRWEITKEEFENCEFPEGINSPTYATEINGNKSKCFLRMHPRGDEEKDKNKVVIFLQLDNGGECQKVRYQVGIKTQVGYWPNDFVKTLYTQEFPAGINGSGSMGTFNAERGHYDNWGYVLCSTEDFGEHFAENKVTVVASFVIYDEGEQYRHHLQVTNNFVDDMRFMSSFDNLSDFTIVSDTNRFPCHRNLLAARSKYFEALFRNEPSKKEAEMDGSDDVVKAMLEFISKGLIPDDIDDKAMNLMMMSDMYCLDLLTVACQTSLVNNLSPDNAVETLIMIDKLKHISKLEHRQKVLSYIKKEVKEVVKARDWNTFVKTYPDLFTEILLLNS